MMARQPSVNDFGALEAALYEDWRAAIQKFAASAENFDVYVVAATFHPEYANPVLSLNTERAFAERVAATYSEVSEAELRRLGGVRWNPGDFTHCDVAPTGTVTRRWLARFEEYVETASDDEMAANADRIADSVHRVVDRLLPSLGSLRRTADFVHYVWPEDPSEQEMIQCARLTVPQHLFDRLFPGVRANEEFMAELALRPAPDQASYWAAALRELVFGLRTDRVRTLQSLGRTHYDVADALTELGDAALPELVGLVERHAIVAEIDESGSPESVHREGVSPSDEVASCALLALERLDHAPDPIIRRLVSVLGEVCERDRLRPHAGLNGQLIARALHALRPDAYPPAQFSATTNHLLNPGDFRVGA